VLLRIALMLFETYVVFHASCNFQLLTFSYCCSAMQFFDLLRIAKSVGKFIAQNFTIVWNASSGRSSLCAYAQSFAMNSNEWGTSQ
jgi:hypothetical protein